MHITPHVEQHFTASAAVRDIVIGMADGLTVPFALAAGLSGAVDSSGLIITAGLAEVAAGAIAMGLGGYLAARTDVEHYASERAIEEREIDEIPEREADEVASVFRAYGLDESNVQQVVRAIRSDRTRWVDFMMKFELGLDPPDPGRARASALTIAGSYVVGGLIPLSPYFLLPLRTCRTAGLGGRDGCRPGRLRLHQRSVHGQNSAAQRLADRGRGGAGRRGRVCLGPLDRRAMSRF